ncbi:MAG: hypothetical protein KAS88_03825 [Deltaproteobacteria bacterium]|nr:hypothetical protein [Deltaproteobacteria bacterium]
MRLFRAIGRKSLFVIVSVFALSLVVTAHSEAAPKRAEESLITARTLSGSMEAKTLNFSGDVVVEDNFTLCSDELFVRYGDGNSIEEVVATGNVRVVQGDKRLRGGRGVYDRSKGEIIITEAASVVECSNLIEGETITLSTDDNTILVEGGVGTDGQRARVVITPANKRTPEEACEESSIYEKFQCDGTR